MNKLHGPVRVPDEAGSGIAKITLSFDDWAEGNVAPAKVEVPVEVITVADSEQIRETLRGHTDLVWSVVFSPDGKVVASSTDQGTVKLWDTAGGKMLATITDDQPGWIYSPAFAPDGKTLAIGCFKREGARLSGEIRLWDMAAGKVRTTLKREPSRGVSRIAFSPDGQTLAAEEAWREAGKREGKVEVVLWDLASEKVRTTLDTFAGSLAFAPDGKSLATAGHQLRIWDVATGKGQNALNGEYSSVAYSPDGRLLAGVNYTGTITLWDVATSEAVSSLELENQPRIYSVAFSPDGKSLAVAMGDRNPRIVGPGEIVLFDVSTLAKRLTLRGHAGAVFSVAFSPDGRTLASGGQDKTVKLWNMLKAKPE